MLLLDAELAFPKLKNLKAFKPPVLFEDVAGALDRCDGVATSFKGLLIFDDEEVAVDVSEAASLFVLFAGLCCKLFKLELLDKLDGNWKNRRNKSDELVV